MDQLTAFHFGNNNFVTFSGVPPAEPAKRRTYFVTFDGLFAGVGDPQTPGDLVCTHSWNYKTKVWEPSNYTNF